MSYDLEVRADDTYSRTEDRERVRDLLRELGAHATGSDTFMLYGGPAHGYAIEIDLGHEGPGRGDGVNFIGLGIPYTLLKAAGRELLDLAFSVATQLGWRVYDPQAGRYFDIAEHAAALDSQATTLASVDRMSVPRDSGSHSFVSRVLDRLIRQTKFMVVVAIVTFGAIGAYAEWAAERCPRHDPRPFVGTVIGAALMIVVLRPLILELVSPSPPSR
jgi:hypothetical protein